MILVLCCHSRCITTTCCDIYDTLLILLLICTLCHSSYSMDFRGRAGEYPLFDMIRGDEALPYQGKALPDHGERSSIRVEQKMAHSF